MRENKLELKVVQQETNCLTIYGAVEYAEQQPIHALWMAFLAASNDDIAKFLEDEYPQLKSEHRDELVEATNNMFAKLDTCFTPEWYNNC